MRVSLAMRIENWELPNGRQHCDRLLAVVAGTPELEMSGLEIVPATMGRFGIAVEKEDRGRMTPPLSADDRIVV